MGIKFECTRCGLCCTNQSGHTVLTVRDVQRLSDQLGIGIPEFARSYCYLLVRRIWDDTDLIAELKDLCLLSKGGSCVFLIGNLCGINDAKPLTCRSFPFMNSREYVKRASVDQGYFCEGFGSGPTYSDRRVDELVQDHIRAFKLENQELRSADYDITKLFRTEECETVRIDSKLTDVIVMKS